jgi:nucleoside-diphosphate-sugar epimerase
MKRFLVTGGAGFIGAAVCNRLVALGHSVRALDDLSAGVPERLSPDVILHRGDVRDVPKLWTLSITFSTWQPKSLCPNPSTSPATTMT